MKNNKREKVVSKGYTLTIISWENDGDNYRTEYINVDTIEEAKRINKICKELFCSCSNGEGGIGNASGGEGCDTILEYVKNNPDLFPDLEGKDEEDILDYISELSYDLMGDSEYYSYRVCESVTATYSPEDIYLEVIKL